MLSEGARAGAAEVEIEALGLGALKGVTPRTASLGPEQAHELVDRII